MAYVIVPENSTRPFSPQNGNGCLIFASEQDAKDYGASSSKIYPASAYGVLNALPNVRVKHLASNDCVFEFKIGSSWV